LHKHEVLKPIPESLMNPAFHTLQVHAYFYSRNQNLSGWPFQQATVLGYCRYYSTFCRHITKVLWMT